MTRIVGIVLVQNEELYVRQAVGNILQFCDQIILCDNKSVDGTYRILEQISRCHSHVQLHSITHPKESHAHLSTFAGTPTWVFGVDGDEIYDPAGLALFRDRILSGEFRNLWRMKGHAFHCDELSEGKAWGFASPPCRSITKLYNFEAISSWDGDTFERLHGGNIAFREGWQDSTKRNLQDELLWEECPLRCLHLCFLNRSSQGGDSLARRNIVEIYQSSFRDKLIHWLLRLLGKNQGSRWKYAHYRAGQRICVDALPFFPAKSSTDL